MRLHRLLFISCWKLGFALTDKYTKRAGMDYWESVDLHKVNSMDDMFKQFPDGRFFI